MGSLRKQILISLHFLALSFIQLLELQEATVLRLVWMVELLFLGFVHGVGDHLFVKHRLTLG